VALTDVTAPADGAVADAAPEPVDMPAHVETGAAPSPKTGVVGSTEQRGQKLKMSRALNHVEVATKFFRIRPKMADVHIDAVTWNISKDGMYIAHASHSRGNASFCPIDEQVLPFMKCLLEALAKDYDVQYSGSIDDFVIRGADGATRGVRVVGAGSTIEFVCT
jgi:hypothetical protein